MKKIQLEKLFLLISLFFGIILVFVVPPFQSPDESAHFLKAYMISEADFFPNKDGSNAGYCIPNELNEYIANKDAYISDLNAKYSYSDIYYDQLLSTNYDSCTFRSIATQNVSILAHIVPATGITLTNIFDIFPSDTSEGPAVKLQFARFFCLVIYSLICYFAIKKTPKFKKSLFLILLLPNSLLLRTMVSYDGLIMSTVALTLALILSLIYDDNAKFNKWHLLWFIFSGYILLNIKTIYSIIFILLFAIPKEKFGTKNDKIKKYAMVAGFIIFFTMLNKLIYSGLGGSSPDIVSEQLSFIKGNLFEVFKILTYNILSQFRSQMYWMIGTYGLLDTYMPQLFVFIVYILLFITILSDIFNNENKIPILYRLLLLFFTILAVYGMYGIMYLDWTPKVTATVGGSEVTGIQGRYYLPLLLLLPIIFNNNLISKVKNENIKNVLKQIDKFLENYTFICTCLLLTLVVIFILLRFYM